MKHLFLVIALILTACIQPNVDRGAAYAPFKGSVRLAHSLDRVLREDVIVPLKSIEIKGGMNEWVSFQIQVRSSSAAKIISVHDSGFVSENGTSVPELTVQYFRAHQIRLDQGSKINSGFRAGWYPDALIPFVHPETKEELSGARFDALPFILPGEETHTFWADIKIPQGLQPGVYTTYCTVETSTGKVEDLKVDLTVWNLTLPEKNSLPTLFGDPLRFISSFYSKTGDSYYNSLSDAGWSQISRNVNTLLKDHRQSPEITWYDFWLPVESDGNFNITPEMTAVLQDFIDTWKPAALEVPIARTHSLKQIVFQDAWYDYHQYRQEDFTPEAQNRLINFMRAWDSALDSLTRKEGTLFYLYLCDEPRGSEGSYNYVRDLGSVIRGLGLKNIEVLVVEKTEPDTPAAGDLYGAVDIWCPSFRDSDVMLSNGRRALGEKVFTYTAMDHLNVPNWLMDYPLIHYRLPLWQIYATGSADGLLYWGLSVWSEIPTLDPWTDARTWSHGPGDYLNSDGSLLYPGKDAGLPNSCVPSIRLKVLRDALEDYEYFVIADMAGLSRGILAEVYSVTTGWTQWSEDPAVLEAARENTGNLIHTLYNR